MSWVFSKEGCDTYLCTNFFSTVKFLLFKFFASSFWQSGIWYSGPTRILARYQSCHVTYLLKISSMSLPLANQSQKKFQDPGFLIGRPVTNNGGNFKLIDHVTILIPCKDSNANILGFSWKVQAAFTSFWMMQMLSSGIVM